jgi:hypothetical protein
MTAGMMDEWPEAIEGGHSEGGGQAGVTTSSLMHLVTAESNCLALGGDEFVEGACRGVVSKRGTRYPASYRDICWA